MTGSEASWLGTGNALGPGGPECFQPTNERYELERVHPNDFLWDAEAGPLPNEWSWLGCHTQMTKE